MLYYVFNFLPLEENVLNRPEKHQPQYKKEYLPTYFRLWIASNICYYKIEKENSTLNDKSLVFVEEIIPNYSFFDKYIVHAQLHTQVNFPVQIILYSRHDGIPIPTNLCHR